MTYNLDAVPIRNRKISYGTGKKEEQSQDRSSSVAIAGAAPLVQQAAKDNVAMSAATTTVPSDGSENFFSNGNKAVGRFENTNTAKPASVKTEEKVVDKSNDLSSALNNSDGVYDTTPKTSFHRDKEKKDGGFFGWLKGVLPKKGKKPGETDDEYDLRRTKNQSMMATLADAVRHLGNIVNTSEGAPLQKFNDPNTALQAGYEKRKAERRVRAAAEADAEYKDRNMKLKERANKANEAYRQYLAQFNERKLQHQKDKDKAEAERKAADAKQKQENWDKSFKEKERHNKASEANSAAKGKKGSSSGGSSSSGKYRVYNKNTGKYEYFSTEAARNQRAAEIGYDLTPGATKSESSESVTVNGVKKNTKTQRGDNISVSLGKQEAKAKAENEAKRKAAQQKKRQASKPAAKPSAKPKVKNGYKNTKALGV